MAVVKTIAHFETTLVDAIDSTSTTLTLDSITTPAGDLPSGTYGFVIEQESNAKREYLVGTLSGSTLTFTLRDLSPLDASTASSSGDTDRQKHRKGSSVKLTNFPVTTQLERIIRGIDGISGQTNPVLYDVEPTLTKRAELATVGYVLDNVTGGSVTFSQLIAIGNAGETVAAGDALYFKTSDQEWYKSDADTFYADAIQFGIAQGSGTDGAAITGGILLRGTDANQTGLSAGSSYYLSETAGEITSTAPSNDVFVGVAKDATSIIVNFENKISGFVSDDEVTSAAELQTQTTSTNTVEVGEADTTTNKNSVAQSFVASKTKMRGVKLFKKADTGTFTGTVTVTLQADNSGEPSGTPLATKTITNAAWVLLTTGKSFYSIFDTEYASLTVGSTYWIDVQPSTSDNSNHINLGADTSGGDGTALYKNATDGWVSITNTYLYYKTVEGIIDQVTKTDATGGIPTVLIKDVSARVTNSTAQTGVSFTWDTTDYDTLSIVNGATTPYTQTEDSSTSLVDATNKFGQEFTTGSDKTIIGSFSGWSDYIGGSTANDQINFTIHDSLTGSALATSSTFTVTSSSKQAFTVTFTPYVLEPNTTYYLVQNNLIATDDDVRAYLKASTAGGHTSTDSGASWSASTSALAGTLTGAGSFLIPEGQGGKYQITLGADVSGGSDGYLYLYVNNTIVARQQTTVATEDGKTLTTVYELNEGDLVFAASDNPLITEYSFLEIMKLRQ